MKRTIAAVTSSRADFSHLYWPLRELASRPEIELKIVAIGPHLSPEFGCTAGEIEKAGFAIDARIECLLSSDSDIGMAKTIGVATLGLADCLGRMRPDLLLFIADRYEMLAPASVALALRIPIAHIEGGEISEGAIDDAVRNALTKLSHVHFTSTEQARARVVAMGEQEWRVHRSGAPSLDHLRRSTLLDLPAGEAAAIVAYHPVTIARDTIREAGALFAALESVEGRLLFCYPNADAGSRALIARARDFLARRGNGEVLVNLDPVAYWSLLRRARFLLGNSSSGIMEAASFALPAVNVGIRQRGREHGRNVLDAQATVDSILACVAQANHPEFRASLTGMQNPYGDGRASERIASVLATIPLGEELLTKR
ncbi:MAG TPA: UDP-N-acetylglucosamine 2-epimerase [Bryobacteraceae bacterium]|jgi:UDP-N-acetylglucosamine 2-epimerase (non-hydrolysing)/GDP/UDP-N,N'-diacetylbacillosamine 2-epimerase (hydrolysing)|nr:UDP-N-acetylglucosamine 2-epimerase [Bryobacteraceae bacterium]